MAFHVSCPITCRRVCDCELGFPAALRGQKARSSFWGQVAALEEFLAEPWLLRPAAAREAVETVQVEVPAVVAAAAEEGDGRGEEAARRHAMVAEDYLRRLEIGGSGALELEGDTTNDWGQQDQGFSGVKVMCRLCFAGENEGSQKAAKMLACKLCSKKYHRSCLKSWAEYRDLFHWSSWACPSCRICEVCRRAGDPNKLMFCKRCDGAYHCYCQQPPHKNVSHGPYLCPKHTRCHSCGSNVPGSGHSTRWFLGYTCCDACGRLFVKGNYCPVCLKVYRDSEVIPMVCCDICEKWVHIECDGISEEKYQQFQTDQNLQYACAACRGECYQIRDTEEAVRELWKRRDMEDHDLIASLRAAAGLPPQEEASSPSPYSDDEQVGPVVIKNDNRKTLKFSFKSNSDKPAVNSLEQEKSVPKTAGSIKKHSKKKGYQGKVVGDQEEIYLERRQSTLGDQVIDDKSSVKNNGTEVISSSVAGSPEKDLKSSFVTKLEANNVDMVPKVKIKSTKTPSLRFKEVGGENVGKSETGRGTKLVIHIGSRNRNSSGSPRSETSSCQKDQEPGAMHGGKIDATSQFRSSRNETKEKSVMKLVRDSGTQQRNPNLLDDLATSRSHATGKRSNTIGTGAETPSESGTRSRTFGQKQPSGANQQRENQGTPSLLSASNSPNDLKPLLKLKFKSPYFEQRSTWASQQEESNSVKGQRSKRKRPSMEKIDASENEYLAKRHQQSASDEAMDANWILRKLGKDAIGKRVEVHRSSDGSWQQGVVYDVIQGTSSLSVRLDNGRFETLELGKQAIRFIAQRTKSGRK